MGIDKLEIAIYTVKSENATFMRMQNLIWARSQKERKIQLMEDLLQILSDLHPDVDFETQDNLIDDTISAEHIIPENFNSAQALYELILKLEDEE